MSTQMDELIALVRRVAQEEIMPRFTLVERAHKSDGSIVTAADLACQDKIKTELRLRYPDYVFLAEEMTAQQQSQLLTSEQPIWCLDPLDGTSNFAAGIPYFSVSLCLICRGEVELAIVYDPVRDESFSAQRGQGARLNGQELRVQDPALALSQSIALVDFKRLPVELKQKLILNPPYASQRSFGSVALDWCWLAMGRVHVYLHGRSNIWDYAGGEFICREAGGVSCTLEAEPIFIKAALPRSCVGAVSESLFESWRTYLQIAALR